MTKTKTGRPTSMTDAIIRKLEDAYALGCSDREAALYAGIACSTLYRYQTEHPEFKERKEALKERPVLKARAAVMDSLESENEKERALMARWYLEHKKADEFSTRAEVAVAADAVLSIEERGEAARSFLNGLKRGRADDAP